MKTIQNPFKNLVLDPEEKEINDAIESGKITFVKISPKERKRLQKIAKYTLEKVKNINLRLSENDLQNLKVKAMEEGMPYQTLAASILHKYTTGRLKQVE